MKKYGFHHLVWEELTSKFGPIVGLRLGRDRIALISGQSAVKQILLKEEFDARPDGFFFRMRSYKKRLGKFERIGNENATERATVRKKKYIKNKNQITHPPFRCPFVHFFPISAGIVFVEGNHFQEQKKFCMMALKKLGMGKKVMEQIIMKEAEELVRSIRDKCRENNIFQMENIFDITVLNSLWALMAGTLPISKSIVFSVF